MNRTFPASLPRSRTPGTLTGTAPIPVITSRSGRWPCRTDRAPPSSVRFPEWASSNTERSASTACWIRSRPSARGMSVSGSAENPCGSGKAVRVVVVRWHILFSARMAAPQQRHDMPPIRGHHRLSTISPRMAGKFGVYITDPPISYALQQRQTDVDKPLHHKIPRRIRGPDRAYFVEKVVGFGAFMRAAGLIFLGSPRLARLVILRWLPLA